MKQPVLGILATLLVCVVSLGLISLFDFPMFAGWVSYVLLCIIPMQIVMLALWRTAQPRFAAAQKQPMKGILITLSAAVWGAAMAAVYFMTVGGNVSPPAPMLIMFCIVSVPVTFFL